MLPYPHQKQILAHKNKKTPSLIRLKENNSDYIYHNLTLILFFFTISYSRAQIGNGRLRQCGQNHNTISIFNERGGAHKSNDWLKCRGGRLEKHPLFSMGPCRYDDTTLLYLNQFIR